MSGTQLLLVQGIQARDPIIISKGYSYLLLKDHSYLIINISRKADIDESICHSWWSASGDIETTFEAVHRPEELSPSFMADGVLSTGHFSMKPNSKSKSVSKTNIVVPGVRSVFLLEVIPEKQEGLNSLDAT